MSFLKGLFGGKSSGLKPEDRAALEQYLAAADPLLDQLDLEYEQWLQRAGISRGTDLAGINDPKGEHSGVFVWRTIEAERNFTQIHPPRLAIRLHDKYVSCFEGRHRAASQAYEALQVADVRSPKSALEHASQNLGEAQSQRKRAESEREQIDRLLR
jgi:hypothetical protein